MERLPLGEFDWNPLEDGSGCSHEGNCVGGNHACQHCFDSAKQAARKITDENAALKSALAKAEKERDEARAALSALYTFPGVRVLLAPSGSLGSIADQVEAVLGARK